MAAWRLAKYGAQPTLAGIKHIKIAFCPFDPYTGTGTSRWFLNELHKKEIKETNPACKIESELRHDGSEPIIQVTYEDGDMSEYFPRTEYQDNIMSEFFKKTNMKQMENGSGGCS